MRVVLTSFFHNTVAVCTISFRLSFIKKGEDKT